LSRRFIISRAARKGGAEMSETAAKIHFSVVFIFEK